MTPYGDMDLGQHWLRLWLVAWRHQAITWTSVDLSSVMFCGIHPRALSYKDFKIPINKTRLKIENFKITSKSHRGQWVQRCLECYPESFHCSSLFRQFSPSYSSCVLGDFLHCTLILIVSLQVFVVINVSSFWVGFIELFPSFVVVHRSLALRVSWFSRVIDPYGVGIGFDFSSTADIISGAYPKPNRLWKMKYVIYRLSAIFVRIFHWKPETWFISSLELLLKVCKKRLILLGHFGPPNESKFKLLTILLKSFPWIHINLASKARFLVPKMSQNASLWSLSTKAFLGLTSVLLHMFIASTFRGVENMGLRGPMFGPLWTPK